MPAHSARLVRAFVRLARIFCCALLTLQYMLVLVVLGGGRCCEKARLWFDCVFSERLRLLLVLGFAWKARNGFLAWVAVRKREVVKLACLFMWGGCLGEVSAA